LSRCHCHHGAIANLDLLLGMQTQECWPRPLTTAGFFSSFMLHSVPVNVAAVHQLVLPHCPQHASLVSTATEARFWSCLRPKFGHTSPSPACSIKRRCPVKHTQPVHSAPTRKTLRDAREEPIPGLIEHSSCRKCLKCPKHTNKNKNKEV
jgi:hypothetical protein